MPYVPKISSKQTQLFSDLNVNAMQNSIKIDSFGRGELNQEMQYFKLKVVNHFRLVIISVHSFEGTIFSCNFVCLKPEQYV
jgi:hypothetical protein